MPKRACDEAPRLFVNDAALDVERCYKAAGLRRTASRNIPGDCIITELQFMSRLHAERARALMGEDHAVLGTCDECIAEFERIHLRKWAEAFFESVQRETRIDAYRLIGSMGEAFFAWRLG